MSAAHMEGCHASGLPLGRGSCGCDGVGFPAPQYRRFPIQGGLTVSWSAAEQAYAGYSRLFGRGQTLERLAERGGFGLEEFALLTLVAKFAGPDIAWARRRLEHDSDLLAATLAGADVRSR